MKLLPVLIFLLILAFTISCQDYKTLRDISYTTSLQSDNQKLDLYLPESQQPLPCLVWIHGGAWLAGSKDELEVEIDMLLEHGYALASIGYRLSSEAIFPAQIYDCKTAIRFIKENSAKYNIDSSKIVVAGASAGGYLAALVGTSASVKTLEDKNMGSANASSTVQAVIDFYGPTDFLIMDDLPDICMDPMIHLDPDSPESRLLGCNIVDCSDKVEEANPITYVSKDDPPFLIFHGISDCTVTPKSSHLLQKELDKNNIPVSLHLIADAGHGGRAFSSNEVKKQILDFLSKTIK